MKNNLAILMRTAANHWLTLIASTAGDPAPTRLVARTDGRDRRADDVLDINPDAPPPKPVGQRVGGFNAGDIYVHDTDGHPRTAMVVADRDNGNHARMRFLDDERTFDTSWNDFTGIRGRGWRLKEPDSDT